jgi:hypothetical protein
MKLILSLFLCFALQPPSPDKPRLPIDPNWIYTNSLHWAHAPRGIHERSAPANVAVLYPDGQYFEVIAYLIGYDDKIRPINFSAGDGVILRAGTWSRTDEDMIRIHSREVWWDDHVIKHIPRCSDLDRQTCSPPDPMPGPYDTDTCRLEGRSATHLAAALHCKRLILIPLRLTLDQDELKQYAAQASDAERK